MSRPCDNRDFVRVPDGVFVPDPDAPEPDVTGARPATPSDATHLESEAPRDAKQPSSVAGDAAAAVAAGGQMSSIEKRYAKRMPTTQELQAKVDDGSFMTFLMHETKIRCADATVDAAQKKCNLSFEFPVWFSELLAKETQERIKAIIRERAQAAFLASMSV